ncbi:MAG: deoxyguanosinetriphosphate triphosphohydrolase [Oscillospiraceae bacterium]|jgi:dGTPase|nr:deoxyguanosinetriphosphate triphosphohydrolase [Oscillospiraceae bacterium]
MTIAEEQLQTEHRLLSPYAAFSDGVGSERRNAEEPCAIRTAYQRDRDRVLHTHAFRRLKHKTQVFLSPTGDHYRTRLTHTLEVSQIARTIARALHLNEDLTEAIALGHDLGHTPFGHAGERALDAVCGFPFRHYEQSLRVVEHLEKDGQGLNLTAAVRDGILRHTCDPPAGTLEGQIVRVADRIAYINHDIDDAESGGILSAADLPKDACAVLGTTKSARINALVTDCVTASAELMAKQQPQISLSSEAESAADELHRFMFDAVYTNPLCKSEESKAKDMIVWLFDYYNHVPNAMPAQYVRIAEKEGSSRASADYIAGMTDRFAVAMFEACFVPKPWTKW